MCGFAVSENKSLCASQVQKEVIASLWNRGPTSQNIVETNGLVMAFARLALIDLSHESSQPFESRTGQYILVFNGEIYNYVELRHRYLAGFDELEVNGDTKVLIHLWELMGHQCLAQLRGMYSICVYDRLNEELIFARDAIGIKPLYYSTRGGLTVASTLEVFRKIGNPQFDLDSLKEILVFGSVSGTRTDEIGVSRCKPGVVFRYTT